MKTYMRESFYSFYLMKKSEKVVEYRILDHLKCFSMITIFLNLCFHGNYKCHYRRAGVDHKDVVFFFLEKPFNK